MDKVTDEQRATLNQCIGRINPAYFEQVAHQPETAHKPIAVSVGVEQLKTVVAELERLLTEDKFPGGEWQHHDHGDVLAY